jgi:uncharacterized protein YciI
MRLWPIAILLCAMPIASAHAGEPPAAQSPADRTEKAMFAIVYRAGPAWNIGRPMAEQGLGDHARYMKRLSDDGVIHTAGPWGADGGIVLLRARDEAEAGALLAADPAVKTGLFLGEVRRFVPRFTSSTPLAAGR